MTRALAHQKLRLVSETRMMQKRSRRNVALAIGTVLAGLVFALWQRSRSLQRANASIIVAQAGLVESEKKRETAEVRTHRKRCPRPEGSDPTKLVMLSRDVEHLPKPAQQGPENGQTHRAHRGRGQPFIGRYRLGH